MNVSNYWMNDALKTFQVILTFEERYKYIGCQVCKVLSRTISWRGQLRKSPRKSSPWDLFPEPDCVTSMRWAQLRITFSLRKRMARESPNVFFNVWLLSFEPGPDPNIICATRPRPVQTLTQCPQIGNCSVYRIQQNRCLLLFNLKTKKEWSFET
jgi:hypothetical protein